MRPPPLGGGLGWRLGSGNGNGQHATATHIIEYRRLSFLADLRPWLACAALALAGCGGSDSPAASSGGGSLAVSAGANGSVSADDGNGAVTVPA